jgi:hypothetical protein
LVEDGLTIKGIHQGVLVEGGVWRQEALQFVAILDGVEERKLLEGVFVDPATLHQVL